MQDAGAGKRHAGGSVPLDAIDAGQVADLLADAAALAGALAGQPGAEAVCAEAARAGTAWRTCASPSRSPPPTWTRRSPSTPASCTPDPAPPGSAAPPARTLISKERKRHGVPRAPAITACYI